MATLEYQGNALTQWLPTGGLRGVKRWRPLHQPSYLTWANVLFIHSAFFVLNLCKALTSPNPDKQEAHKYLLNEGRSGP